MLWKVESENSQMSVFRAHTLCMEPVQRASVHIGTWLDSHSLSLPCNSVFQKELSVVCFPLGSATYVAKATMKVWLTHILRFKRELWFQWFDEESIHIIICFLNHWKMSEWGNPLTRLPLHCEITSYWPSNLVWQNALLEIREER